MFWTNNLLSIALTRFFHIFANAYRLQKPDMGYVGGCKFYWKAFTNVLSWHIRISQILTIVKNEAMVDALWCVYAYRLRYGCWCSYIIDNYWCIGLLYTYSVRLLRCSFYSNGHSRASNRGTSNRYGLSRFFCVR